MNFSGWPLILAGLLLACLASFGWAMRNFFSRPAGDTRGMKLISTCGTAFAVLHLGGILWTPAIGSYRAPAAATLYVCALGLFYWALRTNAAKPLSAAFSPDVPVHLMEHGPYRLVRHPFYSSYLLTWTAGTIATAWFWLLPTVAVMVVVYVRAARMEEEDRKSTRLNSSH